MLGYAKLCYSYAQLCSIMLHIMPIMLDYANYALCSDSAIMPKSNAGIIGLAQTSRGAEVRVTLHWTTSEGRSYRSMVQSEPINLKLLTITNNGEFITTMSVTSDS